MFIVLPAIVQLNRQAFEHRLVGGGWQSVYHQRGIKRRAAHIHADQVAAGMRAQRAQGLL